MKEREELLTGAEPVTHVAVLQSTAGHFTGPSAAFLLRETSARGAHRMLTQSMVPHHLVNETTLLARLADFRAVLLPDQRYLPPELVAALGDWVRAGGVLVAMGLTGTLDEHYGDRGGLALGELLGVELVGRYEPSHAYLEITHESLRPGTLDMPHLAETDFALVRPTAADVAELARLRRAYLRSDGEYLLRWSPVGEDSGHPAITLRKVGEGAGDLRRRRHLPCLPGQEPVEPPARAGEPAGSDAAGAAGAGGGARLAGDGADAPAGEAAGASAQPARRSCRGHQLPLRRGGVACEERAGARALRRSSGGGDPGARRRAGAMDLRGGCGDGGGAGGLPAHRRGRERGVGTQAASGGVHSCFCAHSRCSETGVHKHAMVGYTRPSRRDSDD